MNAETLERLVAEDESSYLEFKESLNLQTRDGKAKFIKEMLALANSTQEDAFLIVGIEDKTKRLTGVKDLGEEQLQQLVAEYCRPPVLFSFKIVEHQNVPLGVVKVSGSGPCPHTLRRRFGPPDSDNGRIQPIEDQVYVRRGSTIDVATPEEVIAMSQARGSQNEQQAKAIFELERIRDELVEIGYGLKEVSNELFESRPRSEIDRLIEGTFVSIIAGGLFGWTWSLNSPLSPILIGPISVMIISVMASALKIIHSGLLRAIICSVTLGSAVGFVFQLSNWLGILGGSSRDMWVQIGYGAAVGLVVGAIIIALLDHAERSMRR